ncbi:MAG: hypothetical protein ABEJ07_04005 [Candidatus Nanohaloarchaea archaeon]
MAGIRLEDNNRRERNEENISLIVESYWEVIKKLVTALVNLKGYKSYSQECLISFMEEFHDFSQSELELMDQLRRLRNDIDYRREFLDQDYLDRNEETIEEIIDRLEEKVEKELDKS